MQKEYNGGRGPGPGSSSGYVHSNLDKKISVLLQELRPLQVEDGNFRLEHSPWIPDHVGTRRLLTEISGTPPRYFSSAQAQSVRTPL